MRAMMRIHEPDVYSKIVSTVALKNTNLMFFCSDGFHTMFKCSPCFQNPNFNLLFNQAYISFMIFSYFLKIHISNV